MLILKRERFVSPYCMETTYRRLSQSPSVSDGVVTTTSLYEDFDFTADSMSIKSSDFDIDNILSVGSFDMLKPTYLTTLSSMEFADRFQGINLTPKS